MCSHSCTPVTMHSIFVPLIISVAVANQIQVPYIAMRDI